MEFSKKIVVGFLIAATIILVASFFLMYKTQDISPLNEIIIGLSALGMSIFSFYFWKAKSENLLKIERELGKDKTEEINEKINAD